MTSCSSSAAPSACEQGWPSAGVWALGWLGSLPLSGRTAAHALLPGSVIGFVQAGACLCDGPGSFLPFCEMPEPLREAGVAGEDIRDRSPAAGTGSAQAELWGSRSGTAQPVCRVSVNRMKLGPRPPLPELEKRGLATSCA